MFGRKKRLMQLIEKSFGQNPLEGNSYYNANDRIEEVGRFHKLLSKQIDKGQLVDEITWNDLEMDQVFVRINHTNSFIGEQMLYHRLHKLCNEGLEKIRDEIAKEQLA